MSLLSRNLNSIFGAALAALVCLAGQVWARPPTEGDLCLRKLPGTAAFVDEGKGSAVATDESARSRGSVAVPALEITVDGGLPVRVDQKRGGYVAGLSLSGKHLVRVRRDGRPFETTHFSFGQSSLLELHYDPFYAHVQIGPRRDADARCAKREAASPVPPNQMSTDALAAEFRRLWQAAAYPSTVCCNADANDLNLWGSRLQLVMGVLGQRLGRGTPRLRLLELMGPPTRVARPGDSEWRFATSARATEIELYSWRGNDLLYFEVEGDVVIHENWFYPFE